MNSLLCYHSHWRLSYHLDESVVHQAVPSLGNSLAAINSRKQTLRKSSIRSASIPLQLEKALFQFERWPNFTSSMHCATMAPNNIFSNPFERPFVSPRRYFSQLVNLTHFATDWSRNYCLSRILGQSRLGLRWRLNQLHYVCQGSRRPGEDDAVFVPMLSSLGRRDTTRSRMTRGGLCHGLSFRNP